jgi:hypothetical protein
MDGEGCFTLARNTNKPDWNRRPMMAAMQKKLVPLAKLHTMFGGTVRKSGAGKKYFSWQLSTREMAVVIPWLIPHLVMKQEEAEIVLAYAATVRRSRPGGGAIEQDEIDYRQALVDRLGVIRLG